MKLRYASASPFVRKVVIAAIELDLDDRIERIPTNVWDPATDIAEHNPLSKVPTLITDDGDVLFDSPVICEYLDELAGGGLYPRSGAARWRVLRLQALADGILDAAVLRRLESLRPENLRSADWDARQQRAVARALDDLESRMDEFAGALNAAHIAAGAALGYLDFRFAADDWRAAHPKLATWFEDFSKRPSMRATVPADAKPAA